MQLIDTGLVISKKLRVVLPAMVGRRLYAIYNLLEQQGNEFGIYLKGGWEPSAPGGPAVVVGAAEFYFPAQDVSPGHIKFLDEPPDPSWNVVVHRHPPSVRTFSGVDDGSINREFLASALYIPPWDFPDAIVNIPVAPGVKVQVKADVVIEGDMLEEMAELRARVRCLVNPPKPVLPDAPAPDAPAPDAPAPDAPAPDAPEAAPAYVPFATFGGPAVAPGGAAAWPRNGVCEPAE